MVKEISLALENTLNTLLKAGYDPDLGVYVYNGNAAKIMTEISFLEGDWFCLLQRTDNRVPKND